MSDAQKFMARNRAPRVQIEYDVELYGAEKKVQLPFVMGVMSDLAGKSKVAQGEIDDSKFLEIDVDNFDDRMQSMAPRAAFNVPNTLTGEGSMSVDLTFTSMSDFSPGAIAEKVDALRPLLEARQQLSDLMAYMDGKSGAEALIETILGNPALLGAIAKGNGEAGPERDATLDALRAAPVVEGRVDTAGDVLSGLRNIEIAEDATDDSSVALDALRAASPAETGPSDEAGDTLDALRMAAVPETEAEDTGGVILDALRDKGAPSDIMPDTKAQALDALREVDVGAPPEPQEPTTLDDLRAMDLPDEMEPESTADIALEALRDADVTLPEDDSADLAEVLSALQTPQSEEADGSNVAATLGGLEAPVVDETEEEDLRDVFATVETSEAADDVVDPGSVLSALEMPERQDGEAEDTADDVLATIEKYDDLSEAEPESAAPDDVLAALDAVEPDTDDDVDLDVLLAGMEAQKPDVDDDADDVLATLEMVEDSAGEAEDELSALLADLGGTEEEPDEDTDTADAVLSGLEPVKTPETQGDDDLDTILSDLEDAVDDEDADDDLDALLSGLGETETAENTAEDDLDALSDELDKVSVEEDGDLDALLAGLNADKDEDADDADEDDLDALLAGLESDDSSDDAAEEDDTEAAGSDEDEDDLEALLAGLDDDESSDEAEADSDDELDALLAGLEDDVDDVSVDLDVEDRNEFEARDAEPELAFGSFSDARPDPQKLNRKRFRLAILGDFTGRAAHRKIAIGDEMATATPIPLDPDTVEDVIESFATTLMLPIGKDGAGVEIALKGLDSLHPDELFENVALFSALRDLKAQLSHGGTAEHAAKTLRAWGEEHGRKITPTCAVSGGNTVRADLKLSDFQKLIGDTGGSLAQASPIDDLLARVVGPYIRKLPDPDVRAMQAAVDEAISGAMRLILHHPEFKSVEAQWRAIDLIARSIEVDDTLDVVLYDISAEEIASDITQSDDLSQSGLVRLLTEEPLDAENGRGGYSALIGMYTFEETPPHAQILGRIARVAAHIDAPFFAAMTPGFVETPKKDRHPLVASEWDRLRGMSEAGHLGLVTPRFMLRRPYGAKTEPIYEFEFEEFTNSVGLGGLLWANPVVLVAILLAKSFKQNGPAMGLGQIMGLGNIPFHYVTDAHGDQVQLPCTERNLTQSKVETVLGRGFMPVVSIKGRDEIRLGSFQSVAGGDILGPWTGVEPPPPSPAKPQEPVVADADTGADEDDDMAEFTASDEDDDDDLELLLSGFDLDSEGLDDDDDDEMDDELAALLADL